MSRPGRSPGTGRQSLSSTITEVAERAVVSTATVSRVFAHPDRVSEDLRERVYRAARMLDYHPSRVARHLRVGTSMTVGVVIPDIQNPFFTAVVRGIEEVLQAAGYTLLLANSDEIPAREERALDMLRADGVAGIVFVPIGERKVGYRQLSSRPLPIVAIDRLPTGLRVDLVTVENTDGSRRAVEHLIELGHREIALLGGPPQHSTGSERQEGYERALRAAGIPLRQELIQHGDFREAGGYHGMKALLGISSPPTAVFVANNLMALGALRAIHEAGRRIPLDIAVVSFDDMPWATSLNPPLSSVAQPAWEIGEAAGELLLARIAEPDRPVRHVVLETQLMVRASSGGPVQTPATHQPAECPVTPIRVLST
ncbi:MAG: LacI family DNA-binding transcriptional regulator [Acidobacteria bacterium]|nr:LacI family DNA-binding transcriptional regulator [Acidobacteriota bacterium]